MHQALTSSELSTWTSQFHLAASGRNILTCLISFCDMAFTRAVCAELASKAPCVLAWEIRLLYCWAASCCKASSETMLDMYCLRSTPTVPLSVVWTAAQAPSSVRADTAPAAAMRRIVEVCFFMAVKLL